MKAYIYRPDGLFIDDWIFAAYLGFQKRGIEMIFFNNFEELSEYKINKSDIVVTVIEDTIKYFNLAGIYIPKPLNIPNDLKEYTKRNYEVMTMGEFKKDKRLPIFIKPFDKLKSFCSGVITKEESKRLFFTDIDDSETVLISEPIDIISEYRCFVHKGKLVGIKHYLGDFTIFPDVNIINNAIKDYKSAPVSYTIDFGITSDSECILIECNDAWSIGNYGLDGDIYVRLLIDRWREIISK